MGHDVIHRSAPQCIAPARLEEALRSSRVPGIVFVQRRNERRPAVAFSGMEVWEVIATWKESGENREELIKAF